MTVYLMKRENCTLLTFVGQDFSLFCEPLASLPTIEVSFPISVLFKKGNGMGTKVHWQIY